MPQFRVTRFALLPPLVMAPSLAFGDGPCRPGDTLIGESARYYYCSRVTCADLGVQLGKDQHALKTLRESAFASNSELEAWKRENYAAQRQALEDAKHFLVDSALSSITASREAKLESIEKDIDRADPMGTTVNAKLLKIANFRRSYAKLVTQIAALKIVEYPGMDIYRTWDDFKQRAANVGKETQVLASTWDKLASDAEVQRAFRDHGFEFSANTLKQALSIPILRQSLDLGQFLSDSLYDWTKWELSRERIEQNLALDDSNLYAECVLSRHLRITVRDYNICKGKMPDDNAQRPEAIVCVDKSKNLH